LKVRDNVGALIVTNAFVILITIGGILPITTYGQVLDHPKPVLTASVNQGGFPNGTNNTRCNCVVFRMDDIQGGWIENAQLAPMNLFISKNQSLTLGLIMNYMPNSNDSKIISKVHEGEQKGLFELALHGWNHVDYTKLSEQEQKDTLIQANEKMQGLFGHKSNIFITPLDRFNNATIKAMSQLGLRILSSGAKAENNFGQNKSVFIDDGKINNNETRQVVYHLPTTITYHDFINGTWIKIPLKDILAAVDNNIAKYGYAVIVLHPQDFAKSIVAVDKNGQYVNLVDLNEIADLSHLIDSILSKNIHITSFSKIVGIEPMSLASSLP
jgi:peptidoglycan/xylan/chitin deacetylase (PgdA/CDA1 family)